MNYTEMVVFIVYLLFMLSIGIWFFYKNRQGGEKTYFLGGRQMGPWVTALSAGASDMSAWVLMGLPTSIYALGLGQAWISIGLLTGYSLSWIFQAPRLRRFSIVANDAITIPQYLSNRFLSKSHVLQVICAIVFLIAYTIYSASSIKACGTLFNTVIGIDQTYTMYVAAFIIIGVLTGMSQGHVAIVMPIVAAMQTGSLNLAGVAMAFGIAGQMLTPTHMCLVITVDYFKANFFKTLKPVLLCEIIILTLFTAYTYFTW